MQHNRDYLRQLLLKEEARITLRNMLLEGANSGFGAVADDKFFESLRQRAREHATE